MLLVAALTGPVYYLIAVFTMPVGLGLLMLVFDKPVLAMYPLLFAGQEHSRDVVSYALNTRVSFPLTLLQWVLIAWLYSRKAPDVSRPKQVGVALLVALLVGLAFFVLFYATSIHIVSPMRWHM
jgi:lipopolysaccharide export LptBFGC system permease protein LptF